MKPNAALSNTYLTGLRPPTIDEMRDDYGPFAAGKIGLDYDRYRHLFADLDLSEADKRQLLEAVLMIMRTVMDEATSTR